MLSDVSGILALAAKLHISLTETQKAWLAYYDSLDKLRALPDSIICSANCLGTALGSIVCTEIRAQQQSSGGRTQLQLSPADNPLQLNFKIPYKGHPYKLNESITEFIRQAPLLMQDMGPAFEQEATQVKLLGTQRANIFPPSLAKAWASQRTFPATWRAVEDFMRRETNQTRLYERSIYFMKLCTFRPEEQETLHAYVNRLGKLIDLNKLLFPGIDFDKGEIAKLVGELLYGGLDTECRRELAKKFPGNNGDADPCFDDLFQVLEFLRTLGTAHQRFLAPERTVKDDDILQVLWTSIDRKGRENTRQTQGGEADAEARCHWQ